MEEEVQPKSNKKWLWIFLGVVAILIIVFASMFLIKLRNESICNQYFLEGERSAVYLYKCLSLCPTTNITDYKKNTTRGVFDESCTLHCSNKLKEFQENQKYSYEDAATRKCSQLKYKNQINFSEALSCFELLLHNSEEYLPCYNNFFNKYSSVLYTSNITLGEYQKYSIEMTNLTCGDTSANFKVKLIEGTPDLILGILFEFGLGNSRSIKELAPLPGEAREYNIDYPANITNVTKIRAYLMIGNKSTNTLSELYC